VAGHPADRLRTRVREVYVRSVPLLLTALIACKGAEPLAVWSDDPDPLAAEAGSRALVVVPNHDDDDSDGAVDWEQRGQADGDDDFATITLANRRRDTVLRLRDGSPDLRVYHSGRLILSGDGVREWPVPDRARGETIPVQIEVNAWGVIDTLELVDAKKDVIFELPVIGSAPALAHHLLPTERVWVLSVEEWGWSNREMVQALSEGLGSTLDILPGPAFGWDVWVQDEPEFTRAWSPSSVSTLILNSIRDGNGEGGLDPFPGTLVEPDVFEWTLGQGMATTYDAFGNLEASPPVVVNGVNYPLGRIYYGWDGAPTSGNGWDTGPVTGVREHLASITTQEPFWVDTTWLCVGHIDEVTSFVPDPTAPRGFRFLISDTDLGFQAINSVPEDRRLTNHGRRGYEGHNRPFARSYQNDAALRAYNQDIQRDHLEPTLQVFQRELDLQPQEIIRVPAYFEQVADGGFVCGAAAVIPGMVNLLMETDASGTGGRAWIADPFFRSPTDPPQADPFIAMWNDLLPASVEPVYVDNWTVYHMGLGEVHCGTNQERMPALQAVPDLNTWLDEVLR